MKVKVLTTFRDKKSKETHNAGAEITLSKERFDEIEAFQKGIVSEIKPKRKSAAKKKVAEEPEVELEK